MIYFDFEEKFTTTTLDILGSNWFRPRVSVIYWGLNQIMNDLRMA